MVRSDLPSVAPLAKYRSEERCTYRAVLAWAANGVPEREVSSTFEAEALELLRSPGSQIWFVQNSTAGHVIPMKWLSIQQVPVGQGGVATTAADFATNAAGALAQACRHEKSVAAAWERDFRKFKEPDGCTLKAFPLPFAIPNSVLVAGPRVDRQTSKQVTGILLGMGDEPKGKQILEEAKWIDGWCSAEDAEYDVVRKQSVEPPIRVSLHTDRQETELERALFGDRWLTRATGDDLDMHVALTLTEAEGHCRGRLTIQRPIGIVDRELDIDEQCEDVPSLVASRVKEYGIRGLTEVTSPSTRFLEIPAGTDRGILPGASALVRQTGGLLNHPTMRGLVWTSTAGKSEIALLPDPGTWQPAKPPMGVPLEVTIKPSVRAKNLSPAVRCTGARYASSGPRLKCVVEVIDGSDVPWHQRLLGKRPSVREPGMAGWAISIAGEAETRVVDDGQKDQKLYLVIPPDEQSAKFELPFNAVLYEEITIDLLNHGGKRIGPVLIPVWPLYVPIALALVGGILGGAARKEIVSGGVAGVGAGILWSLLNLKMATVPPLTYLVAGFVGGLVGAKYVSTMLRSLIDFVSKLFQAKTGAN